MRLALLLTHDTSDTDKPSGPLQERILALCSFGRSASGIEVSSPVRWAFPLRVSSARWPPSAGRDSQGAKDGNRLYYQANTENPIFPSFEDF